KRPSRRLPVEPDLDDTNGATSEGDEDRRTAAIARGAPPLPAQRPDGVVRVAPPAALGTRDVAPSRRTARAIIEQERRADPRAYQRDRDDYFEPDDFDEESEARLRRAERQAALRAERARAAFEERRRRAERRREARRVRRSRRASARRAFRRRHCGRLVFACDRGSDWACYRAEQVCWR
ncbi:MAG: hypothetical protein AAGG99_09780, partial [Pseudomonadota bacterium]